MSILGAMFTAVSGVNAQSRAIGHISDNIANSQTTGYKRVETRFETLITVSNQNLHSPGGVIASPFISPAGRRGTGACASAGASLVPSPIIATMCPSF